MKKRRTRRTKPPPPLKPPDMEYVKGRIGAALQPTRTEELRQGRDGAPWIFTVDTPKIEQLPDGRYVVDASTLAELMGISGDELLRRHGKDIHHGRRFRIGGRNRGTTKYLTVGEQVSLVNDWSAEKVQNRRWTLEKHVARYLEERGLTFKESELIGLLGVLRHVSRRLRRGERVV